MKSGDIILIPFPLAELSDIKVRPTVIIGFTKDNYKDTIVSAISSVVPEKLSKVEILIYPNNLLMLDRLFKNNYQLKTNTYLKFKDACVDIRMV